MNELSEVGRRTGKGCATQIGKARLHLRIGESGVGALVQLGQWGRHGRSRSSVRAWPTPSPPASSRGSTGRAGMLPASPRTKPRSEASGSMRSRRTAGLVASPQTTLCGPSSKMSPARAIATAVSSGPSGPRSTGSTSGPHPHPTASFLHGTTRLVFATKLSRALVLNRPQ